MASKKLYLTPPPGVVTDFGAFSESAPVDAVMAPNYINFQTAINSGKSQAGHSAELRLGGTATVGVFTSDSTSPKPNGVIYVPNTTINAYRFGPFAGKFEAGLWDISLAWRALTTVNANWFINYKIFSSASATGVGAIQRASGSTSVHSANLNSGNNATVTSAVQVPEFVIDGGYVFLALAVEISGVEDNTTTRTMSMKEGPSTFLETTDITPLGESYIGWIGI